MVDAVLDLSADETGGALVEYALLIALIPAAAVAVIAMFGQQLSSLFAKLASDL